MTVKEFLILSNVASNAAELLDQIGKLPVVQSEYQDPATLPGYRCAAILHNQRKSVLQGFRCPGVHQGAVQCHHAAPVRERTQHEEKEVNLKAGAVLLRLCFGLWLAQLVGFLL